MSKPATKSTRAPAKAAPATDTPPSEKSGPVDETLSSTGRGEGSGEGSVAPQPAKVDAVGEQAQPEAGAVAPVSDATGGSHADGDGHEQSAPETGQAPEDGSAAAATDADTHPAGALIEEARVARGPTDVEAEAGKPDAPIRLTYQVRSPLRHDRRRYSPDDPDSNTIELTEAEAETLIAIGVLGDPIN
ncbi:hypothetical protein MKI84_08535 [Ancylobacter sp. A5.8]|uniref:hypothetical protein n=1 Tax=Ancylobacter gelatini TaxID=2919920 RepID=UPI001F4E6DA3|nr:hypothetical protein [Ancylobacter gelatini]MCJ8142962.1 hypothetical protein [Ancylobacter gelatini]